MPLPLFVALIVFFALAALGIWMYYKFTPEGRKQDVHGDLEEANLQSNLVDTIEETREVTQGLHERVEALRK